MTDITLEPACAAAPRELHAAFAAAFADYLLGPFQVPLDQWPRFLGRQCADLAASRVARHDGAIAAFALVAPRADAASWRLATMGALPAARGSGAARVLLQDFIARAAHAGQAQVELECFAQNERALGLYRAHGFEPLHALHGYRADAAALALPQQPASAEEAGLEDAFAWLEQAAPRAGGLPLQVTPPSLRAQPVRLRAWRSGEAQLVAGENAPGQLTLYSLVDLEPGQAGSAALVAALMRQWPGHSLHVPQLQRLDLGGTALERLGFARLPLHQLWMRRRLAGA